jgi:tRNA (guanine37-N1)-methyltransferase
MRFDILTLFPGMFDGVFDYSIIERAIERSIIDIHMHDIRAFTNDKHHVVDDYPYGGGAGMVMKPEPVFDAVEAVMKEYNGNSSSIILLSPVGRLYNQRVAQQMAQYDHLVLICGHYEGVDERISEHLIDEEISIGDYILSGGEIAAMVVVDSITRLLPGVVGSEASIEEESHVEGLLEYPHYTRPAVFRDWSVPEVLTSGNHSRIARWRRQQSLLRTMKRRPDLMEKYTLSREDQILLDEINA